MPGIGGGGQLNIPLNMPQYTGVLEYILYILSINNLLFFKI